jgi:hypothetical protein
MIQMTPVCSFVRLARVQSQHRIEEAAIRSFILFAHQLRQSDTTQHILVESCFNWPETCAPMCNDSGAGGILTGGGKKKPVFVSSVIISASVWAMPFAFLILMRKANRVLSKGVPIQLKSFHLPPSDRSYLCRHCVGKTQM